MLSSDVLQVALASNAVLKSATTLQPLLKASPAASNATQANQISLPGSAGNPAAIYSTGRYGPCLRHQPCAQLTWSDTADVGRHRICCSHGGRQPVMSHHHCRHLDLVDVTQASQLQQQCVLKACSRPVADTAQGPCLCIRPVCPRCAVWIGRPSKDTCLVLIMARIALHSSLPHAQKVDRFRSLTFGACSRRWQPLQGTRPRARPSMCPSRGPTTFKQSLTSGIMPPPALTGVVVQPMRLDGLPAELVLYRTADPAQMQRGFAVLP